MVSEGRLEEEGRAHGDDVEPSLDAGGGFGRRKEKMAGHGFG